MQLSTLWNYQDMLAFFKQYCKYTYGHENIRIWKAFSYLGTNTVTIGIVESIKDKRYQVKGRLITQERYKELDIDEYLKGIHTLVVEIGEALTDEKEVGEIRGYCEECVTKKLLIVSCVCHEVYYCSEKCRVEDQNFHYKNCTAAFDS